MRYRNHIFFTSLITLLIFFSLATPSYAVKFNVDPPKLNLTIKEGEKKRDYITITNLDQKESIYVKSYIRDIIYLPDSSNDFPPPNSTPWSCAEWIRLNPSEFSLAPGSDQIVKIEVKVPAGATGGYYGIVFFEVQGGEKPPTTGVTVNVRIGTILLVTVKGTATYNAKITKFVARLDAKTKGVLVNCFIQNDSNVLIRPEGVIRILTEKGEKVTEKDLNEKKVGILPKTSKEFMLSFEKEELKKGSYIIQAVIDYGGKTLLGGQTSITIE